MDKKVTKELAKLAKATEDYNDRGFMKYGIEHLAERLKKKEGPSAAILLLRSVAEDLADEWVDELRGERERHEILGCQIKELGAAYRGLYDDLEAASAEEVA